MYVCFQPHEVPDSYIRHGVSDSRSMNESRQRPSSNTNGGRPRPSDASRLSDDRRQEIDTDSSDVEDSHPPIIDDKLLQVRFQLSLEDLKRTSDFRFHFISYKFICVRLCPETL